AQRHRRFADIALLRRLAKTARHRGACPMRIGEVGAAVPGIVRRRCELGRSLLPSPLWGGVGGGGREATRRCQWVLRIRRRSVRRLPTPLPTLPHKGGGNLPRLRANPGAALAD